MGIGLRELVVILLIVLVVFGAKKLKTIGSDLGAAVKGFKQGMSDDTGNDKPAVESKPTEDEQKKAFEAAQSGLRKALFDRIDALTAELVRRYKDGGASVDSLLQN